MSYAECVDLVGSNTLAGELQQSHVPAELSSSAIEMVSLVLSISILIYYVLANEWNLIISP